MTPAQVIVLATPVFLLLIALEVVVGVVRGRNTYRLADALASIGTGILSQLAGLFTVFLMFGIYAAVWEHASLWQLPADAAWVWIAALVLYDLCYYWLHRLGHRVAVLWAAHVVHHQSEDYNLSTALRQTGSNWLFGWIFYLPMAVLGFPPLVFAVVGLVDLLYQFWVHTQQVGKLGWFDRWLCSPSNHRVHHAVNKRYVDRNYGGIFMVWDRLFGSFEPEHDDEPCVYGTRSPLRSWNPLWANLHTYAELWADCRRARRWSDKLKVWLKPPGWRPPDVAAAWPKPAFELARVQRFETPLPPAAAALALALFAAVLAGTSALLWNAHTLAPLPLAAGATLIGAGLWAVGRICTPRSRPALALKTR
jgi:alkylglycerol monooxygenase